MIKLKKTFCNFLAILTNFNTLAFRYGQWKTIRLRQAVSASNDAIPWYTYPAIEYLNTLNFAGCKVFEFGSGNSSRYWAEKSQEVISVEDNSEWFQFSSAHMSENQKVLLKSDRASYVAAISEQNKLFDVIVIDGNWRKDCTIAAMSSLKSGGIIVLDNSDRVEEKSCGKLLRKEGFVQIDFNGFGPINAYCWTTSIFLKANGILQNRLSSAKPIGGIN